MISISVSRSLKLRRIKYKPKLSTKFIMILSIFTICHIFCPILSQI